MKTERLLPAKFTHDLYSNFEKKKNFTLKSLMQDTRSCHGKAYIEQLIDHIDSHFFVL